ITCEGDLSVENTKYWHEKFKKTAKSSNDIRISLKRIEKLDLSFIQLLIALKKTCENEHIKFSITGDLPEYVQETFHVTGIFKQGENRKNAGGGK
ncbi:MAG: STAS domain-containing protein, partial [Spirochaetales bacterium]|nr:STAS domain-containing protein [Spirochaetales bacterium]